MSSINSSIAGSVNQAQLQQAQVAQSQDAKKNRDAERTRKMKELLEKHTHEVEDSTAADTSDMKVRQQQAAEDDRKRKRQPHTDDRDNVAGDETDHEGRLDLKA